MEGEDAESYCLAFQRLFESLSQVTARVVRWRHHSPGGNGEGFQGVAMDMGAGQIKGITNS